MTQVTANIAPVDPLTLLDQLIQEAQQMRGQFEAQWKLNRQRYGGQQWEDPAPKGRTHRVVNMIKRAVDGQVAVMTQSRPRVTVTPEDHPAPAMYAIRQPAGMNLAGKLGMMGQGIAGVFDPSDPASSPLLGQGQMAVLPEAQIKPLIDAGLLTSDDLYRIDAEAVAKTAWRVFDKMWDVYKWDWKIAECIQNAQIIGHRDILVEWDEEKQCIVLSQLPEKNTWIDPIHTDIDDARFFVAAEVLSLAEAVAAYPQHADAIRTHTQQTFTNVSNSSLSEVYNQLYYSTDMVLILTAWVRDQPIPLMNPDGTPAMDQNGQPAFKRGIRQIKVVGDAITIEDGECPWPDIPVVRLKNVPLPDRPYCLGEPEILWDLQQDVNRIISNLGDQARYFANPQAVMVAEARKSLKRADAIHSHPGRTITVSAEVMEQCKGRPVEYWVPPPISGSQMEYLQQIIGMFHEVSMQSDVMRGVQTPEAQSGVAIESLQAAGRGAIAYKSFWCEKAILQIAEMSMHAIQHMMKPGAWGVYVAAYPDDILMMMQAQAKQTRFKVAVELSSGKGFSRQQKQQRAQVMRSEGDYSLTSYMEDMEVEDTEREVQRMTEEAVNKAKLQAKLQAVQMQAEMQAGLPMPGMQGPPQGHPQQPPKEQQQPEPGNGQG